MDTSFRLREAHERDQTAIRRLIREAHINPMDLDWRRFVLAVETSGRVIGCGQVKRHRDGSHELASLAVDPAWRGKGIGEAVIRHLMEHTMPPLWLMCRSGLAGYYERFGFREVTADGVMPAYLRRMRVLAKAHGLFAGTNEQLAIMVWRPGRSDVDDAATR